MLESRSKQGEDKPREEDIEIRDGEAIACDYAMGIG